MHYARNQLGCKPPHLQNRVPYPRDDAGRLLTTRKPYPWLRTSGWLQPSAAHLPATFLFLGNARGRSLIVGPSPRFRFVVGAFRPHRSVSDTTDLNRFALILQPRPRNFDGHPPHPPVAGAADSLLMRAVAALIRHRRQPQRPGDFPSV